MSREKLVIEEFACWGCRACEVACKQEHNPFSYGAYRPDRRDSAKYLSVWEDGPRYQDGKLFTMWRVNVCKHCEDPICVMSCPEGALHKDPETGIVLHDREKCNGCDALPGTLGGEKDGTSPCKGNCPAENDIQGYVSLAAKGEFTRALQLLKETSPFPGVCGRVCHHPCESECNRRQIDESVAIQSVERFLADLDLAGGKPYVPAVKARREQKVAVIGSGPAGLSAAYFLARDGYGVTVFERLPVAGGMLAVGIPEYRLPREVLSAEIGVIERMGVEIRTGVAFGEDTTLEELKGSGYQAFFLATGLHGNKRLDIEKEDLEGVLSGVDFLRAVSLRIPVSIGREVIVVGGGNVAVDAALTSIRKGAGKVIMVCRRDEMVASSHQIMEAEEEGVEIIRGFGPHRFLEREGRLFGVEFKRCISVYDQNGVFCPAYDETDLKRLNADTVIVAIGQAADPSFAEKQGIAIRPGGLLDADPLTLETPLEGVFAGGDACHGPSSVVSAVASGREAALSIDRYLRGLSLRADREKTRRLITNPRKEKFDPSPRTQTARLEPEERVKGFAEIRQGFTAEMAAGEAKRCLSCGTCCIQACPYDAIAFDEETGKTMKCDLCHQRITHGLYPACADNVCLARCIYFDDPAEIEQKILQKRKVRGGWGEVIPKSLTK